MAKIPITSSNISDIEWVTENDQLNLLPGFGAMIITFKRTGQEYAYFPMMKEVFDYHSREMQNPTPVKSANDHFKNNIQNLYESQKL